ncbi:MAG: response regulator transcription factor [Anaerolineae bacterium]|nr:response regulator transcription factor [Anaerolineae bacterium]
MKTTLAVVDTAEVIRIGIKEIISGYQSIELAGEFTCLDEFYKFIQVNSVDLLVLGNTQPYHSLIQDLEKLRQHSPTLKVLLLSNGFTADQIEELSGIGAAGFICKDEQLANTLLFAIQPISRGELFLSPKVASSLFKGNTESNHNPLSQRQMQVVRYMAKYLTPQEIAMRMDTSPSSIYSLQHRIRQVLGAKTTGQILIEAMRRGWIDEEV